MAETTPIFCGNNFVDVEFPRGTRILRAPEHNESLSDPKGAVLNAIRNPLGMKPMKELIKEGSKVTIAFDDLAVPVPPMPPPDNREIAIGAIVEELYAAGVKKRDITLVCANGIHRMWKRSELRTILGDRIMNEFSHAQIIGHDACDPESTVHLGLTENGYDVEINRRVVDSDLTVYVNINWVPFNGGWKSTIIGMGTYKAIRHIHNHEMYLAEAPASCMEPDKNILHARIREMGHHLREHLAGMGKAIFQVETTINSQNPPKISSVTAGDVDLVHEETLRYLDKHKVLEVKGQSDVLVFGLPDFMPYSMGTIINPILIARMGLGYLFANYKNIPLVREGGILILANPLYDQVDPVHHPSYKTLWEEGFERSRNAAELYDLFADEYACRPEFVHKYRHGYGFHGAHPVQAYTTTVYPKIYLSRVFAAGCTNDRVAEKLEWEPYTSVEKAIGGARSLLGKDISITYVSLPPLFHPRVEA